MLRKYESMLVMVPTLSEENVTSELEKVQNFIKEHDGEILNLDNWGKRNLAYEINDLREGYFSVLYFNLNPEQINEYERIIKLNENIIRYNILVKS